MSETIPVFDATMLEAWSANVKAMFDQHLRDGEREREQVNDWRALAIEQARQNQQIVNRLAQDAATLSTRMAGDGATISARLASNAVTLDNIVSAGAVTNPAELAETAIGAKVTEQVRDATRTALDAAIAAATQTAPPAQGTTGVAQASLQAAEAATTNAMMTNMGVAIGSIASSMAELNKAMAVLLLRVTGDVVVAKEV